MAGAQAPGRREPAGGDREGAATRYSLAGAAVIRAYLRTPYNRRPPVKKKNEFVDRYVPNKTFYLGDADRARLRDAGAPHGGALPAGTYARRILERLLVDLAWASSRMEGNTFRHFGHRRSRPD